MKKRIFALLLAALMCLSLTSAALAALAGDIDGDGKVTASDARLALRAAVDLETLTAEQTKLADADRDDKITASDARLILRAAVGLEELPPAEEEPEPYDEGFDYDAIPDEPASETGVYEIAYVSDSAEVKDHGFNEDAWNGVKRFSSENGKTYKYYIPQNAEEAYDADYIAALNAAIENGAKIVVVAGFMFDVALNEVAPAHPDVQFIFMDGYTLADGDGSLIENVLPVTFKEDHAGFLAGYAAVKEGLTKLGFYGGGGGMSPGVNRYGFGYLQGINAAAKELGVTVELKYTTKYAFFSASPEIEALAGELYAGGTEAIMSCGGGIVESIRAAAEAADKLVIGCDSADFVNNYECFMTAACKDFCGAVQSALKLCYEGKAADYAESGMVVGVEEGGVCLPTKVWRMNTFTRAQYEAFLADCRDGKYEISSDYEADFEAAAYRTNVTVTVID
ncbi:MAG: BMP family ABC transporter substrate-binding protein [Clostridia bacterium]|nr:BMP family ABC transporter substrate-binding protein [Clostridia bacterium]